MTKIQFTFILGVMVISALMTIDELAVYLKVSRRTIYEWLKTNKIPAVKLVGQWRFRKERIDAWLEGKARLTPGRR